jgi:prolyl-tRNA editing enzyme YbaK/EbsC (Cys-tRNA(Pro) deacylase)
MRSDKELDLEQKARSIANDIGIQYELVIHKETGATTSDATDALGESIENILKCLILTDKATEQTVGTIIRGDTKLDLKSVQNLTGIKKLKFASPEFVAEFTGFEIGGVPPFIIDKCSQKLVCDLVLVKEYVIGAGGHDHCGAKFSPGELEKIEGVRVERISK